MSLKMMYLWARMHKKRPTYDCGTLWELIPVTYQCQNNCCGRECQPESHFHKIPKFFTPADGTQAH
jgi:hypothetical protein